MREFGPRVPAPHGDEAPDWMGGGSYLVVRRIRVADALEISVDKNGCTGRLNAAHIVLGAGLGLLEPRSRGSPSGHGAVDTPACPRGSIRYPPGNHFDPLCHRRYSEASRRRETPSC